jgi:hypothetical protein
MNDRVQSALDGDISPELLTPGERVEFLETKASIDAVLRATSPHAVPNLATKVLSRIESLELRPRAPSFMARFIEYLWLPRLVSIRPGYVFSAAALLFLVIAGNLFLRSPQVMPQQASGQVLVEFRLEQPAAREVALAGEFTEWEPRYPLQRSASGVWTVVVPLDPGIHTYSFVVDGNRWVPDPDALPVDDGFGGQNSRVAVMKPSSMGKS